MLSSIISGVSFPGASVLGYGLLPPPHRIFYTVVYRVYNLFSGVSAPGASVLGYGLPPRIFYAVVYNLRNFCSRSFCPRVWPPPIEFSTLSSIEYINLFSGVSAPGASVLGYGLPPIEFFTLLSIISFHEFLY